MSTTEALILTRADVAALLTLADCTAAVEAAFNEHAEGRTLGPAVLGVHAAGGGFHVKAAGLLAERSWFAVKCNANFPGNPARCGLPSIQGVLLLFDGANGRPLAVMDSIEITLLRTGAATAVATKHLAREDARVAAIVGCGNQGRVQLRALSSVRRLERVLAHDLDGRLAARFAAEMGGELGLAVEVVADPSAAVRACDVCVTCTPSKRILVHADDVPAGCFVAGVGADNEEKQELDPRLFARAKVVVDSREQCATIGDLHHALVAGVVTRDCVHAELAELVAGRKPGRTSAAEITLFDSTGVALEDVAAAVALYERALERGVGLRLALGA